jgi:arylsulfatase A-like enzyme
MRNEEVIEEPADQTTITERFTAEAVQFIRDHKDEPFFVYLAHNMPHIPLFVSDKFDGVSEGGLYGDVIETIDWGVGEILDTLDELDLADNTIVVFTTDNGPWLVFGEDGGNATPLRAGKGTTYEGGMRVPCIMRWPAQIPAGSVCSEPATTMDLLPTFAKLAGTKAPTDRIIDGKDILPLMRAEEGAKTPHEAIYFYSGRELHAVRSGPWKLRAENTMRNEDIYWRFPDPNARTPEALYYLPTDPGEQKNLTRRKNNKEVKDTLERLRGLLDAARADLGDSLQDIEPTNTRPLGFPKKS